jgi:hypothetical protein
MKTQRFFGLVLVPALKITHSSHNFPVRWLSFLAHGINFFRTCPSVV